MGLSSSLSMQRDGLSFRHALRNEFDTRQAYVSAFVEGA